MDELRPTLITLNSQPHLWKSAEERIAVLKKYSYFPLFNNRNKVFLIFLSTNCFWQLVLDFVAYFSNARLWGTSNVTGSALRHGPSSVSLTINFTFLTLILTSLLKNVFCLLVCTVCFITYYLLKVNFTYLCQIERLKLKTEKKEIKNFYVHYDSKAWIRIRIHTEINCWILNTGFE